MQAPQKPRNSVHEIQTGTCHLPAPCLQTAAYEWSAPGEAGPAGSMQLTRLKRLCHRRVAQGFRQGHVGAAAVRRFAAAPTKINQRSVEHALGNATTQS